MRTIFSLEDVKGIVRAAFKEQTETISINGEDADLFEYMNIAFYTWKNRMESAANWREGLNTSIHTSVALIELVNSEVSASQDIDSATLTGRVTFFVQADKAANLEYYCSKVRNAYIGNAQDITNAYGDELKAYLNFGILLYDEEPETLQLGETVTVSMNFTISYLTSALNYKDTVMELSLDNVTFYHVPYTKATWQAVFFSAPVTRQNRPDLTGYMANSATLVKTISFYDFNKPLIEAINEIFWKVGAIETADVQPNGTFTLAPTTQQNVNVPVYVRVTVSGKVYLYKDIIESIEKVISNGDFNFTSITLKGYGK